MANSPWNSKFPEEYPYGTTPQENELLRQKTQHAQNAMARHSLDTVSLGTLPSGAITASSNSMRDTLGRARKGVSELRVSTIQNGYLVQFCSSMGDDRLDTAIFAATPAELADKIAVYLTTEAMKAL